ncbi:MAG: hypothetical protein LBE76_00975, partial [Nitrososphaerota archaeon]|nr:hypothetical protein [Nitrososphaerota archaeon]
MREMLFDAQIAVFIGAILGSSAGICGGIWGVMAGLFVRKGLHKNVVLIFAVGLIFFGVSVCMGIIALIIQQSYHVWYPFLITGV